MLMLIFFVENDCFCCSCDSILEIIPKVPLKSIPQKPNYFAGLLNYAGDSVPIVDLSMLIAGHPCSSKMHTRIILFKIPFDSTVKILGIMAEKIIETRDIDPDLFTEFRLKIKNLTFLDGIYNTETESIQQINVNLLFNSLPEIFASVND